MRYFLSFIFFISTSFVTYPVFTNTGNYIVYETGLVIPPGAENISFNFVGIEIENEIEEMIVIRKNLFKSKIIIGKRGKPAIVGKKLSQLNLSLNERKKFKDDIYTNYQVN